MAFFHSSDTRLFAPDKYSVDSTPEDVATGPGAPDIEIIYTPLAFRGQGLVLPPNFGEFHFGVHPVLLQSVLFSILRLGAS